MAAPRAYFDTSALLKRYLYEAGAERARAIMRRFRFLSSAIAPVEVTSALARRRAVGDLAERQFAAILNRSRSDRRHWELMELNPQVLNQAEELVLQTPLRPLDAVHVASALSFQSSTGIRVPFVTADMQQREVAGSLGLNVIWVG